VRSVKEIVYECIQAQADMDDNEALMVCDAKTKLFGTNAALDSMGLVMLVVEVETRVREESEKDITLADEKAMSRTTSPFRTVGSLIAYVEELLA
jgi:acyl carrier protein